MLTAPSLELDAPRLHALADRHAEAYRTARPFPHVVMDDFLPSGVATGVEAQFPAPEDDAWHRYSNARERKLMASDEVLMPPAVRQVLAQLNGPVFLDFLERLTGIDGLIPDPYLLGGGMHQIQQGGFLKIHADFNRHPRLRLDRRLNLLLYLNPRWEEEYGGHLELWDRTMTRCEQRILPVFNRCVVFSTTSYAYHGHPTPLTCPEDRVRRSMALYYYTNGRPADEVIAEEHSTLFRRTPSERVTIDRAVLRQRAGLLVSDLLPPLATRGLRRLRKRRSSGTDR